MPSLPFERSAASMGTSHGAPNRAHTTLCRFGERERPRGETPRSALCVDWSGRARPSRWCLLEGRRCATRTRPRLEAAPRRPLRSHAAEQEHGLSWNGAAGDVPAHRRIEPGAIRRRVRTRACEEITAIARRARAAARHVKPDDGLTVHGSTRARAWYDVIDERSTVLDRRGHVVEVQGVVRVDRLLHRRFALHGSTAPSCG